jgi:hypothetical protein
MSETTPIKNESLDEAGKAEFYRQVACDLVRLLAGVRPTMRRGVMDLAQLPHTFVVFGVEDCRDEQVRLAIDLLRQRLDDAGVKELDFVGWNDPAGEPAWVMLILAREDPETLHWLTHLVAESWAVAAT